MTTATLGVEQSVSGFPPAGRQHLQATESLAGPRELARGTANVAELVLRHVQDKPDAVAILHSEEPGREAPGPVTFGELGDATARFAAGLRAAGIGPGDRIALLGPVSADFHALAIAVLAVGAAVVVVEGSMRPAVLARALWNARPSAVVGPRRILRYWPFVPALTQAVRYAAEGRSLGVKALDDLRGEPHPLAVERVEADNPAVVSFTSGTTGRPKTIIRTHGLLCAQHAALAANFAAGPGEISLATFPMIVLHNLCSGVPSVLAARQGDVAMVEAAIVEHGVTSLACAPALLELLLSRIAIRRPPMPTLRRVIVGGGPVSRSLCERLTSLMPRVHGVVAYGSTEAEPIASVGFPEVVASFGDGYLVGAPAAGVEVAVVCLPERAIALGPMGVLPFQVPTGTAGEVVVRGAHVRTRRADGSPARTALASADGRHWHRTGDIARLDARGRLWLLGRAGDAVTHHGRQLHPFTVESAVKGIRCVTAAALLAHPAAPHGELVVALGTAAPGDTLGRIRAMLDARGLDGIPIRQVAHIPMDARHASKVDRIALRAFLRFTS